MKPVTEDELGETVRQAKAPLAIRGGGTRLTGLAGEALSVAGLRGITLYEPGALTMVAQAGTPLAEIEAALAAENQRLAFEPMDHRGLLGTQGAPTIGGVFATNTSGPRRVQAGAARDFLLGVRYIDGMGQAIKNGGRVMKNVTGYDLVKLMAGSWGTLGVLSEVSFKVLPRPETEATLRFAVDGAGAAVRLLSAALGSPFEVSGAAYDPAQGAALVRIEGFGDSVTYRAGRLTALLGAAELVEAAASSALWAALRDVAPFQGQGGDVWRLSCKPSQAPEVAARLGAEALLFDWGGGLIWARVAEGTDLRARAGSYDGHATLIRATPETRARLAMFQPQPAPLAALAAGLRAKFDPKGIFNPGLMG
ncbi:MAG: glycolate oxidase subunit GlcE [Pseudodonghicola sp.]